MALPHADARPVHKFTRANEFRDLSALSRNFFSAELSGLLALWGGQDEEGSQSDHCVVSREEAQIGDNETNVSAYLP